MLVTTKRTHESLVHDLQAS